GGSARDSVRRRDAPGAQANQTEAVLDRHITRGLEGLTAAALADKLGASEPVGAVGAGKNATPGQARERHTFLRPRVSQEVGAAAAEQLHIQYGGSVNPGNAASLLGQPDVDGALVGGASLKADQFLAIVRAGM